MKYIIVFIGVIAIIISAILYSVFMWGLVLYKFWYWFLLPIFTELPEITYLMAVGLMLFIGLFQSHFSISIKDKYLKKSYEYLNLLTPIITLSIGWFIHLIFN